LPRLGIGQGVGTHRKVFARFVQRWLIAIQADVIWRNAFNRFDARIRQLHAAIFLHTAVEAIFLNHFRAHGFLLHFIQLGVFFAKISLRGQIQPCFQFAVQPIGRPVGGLVSAVAENRAQLHAAGALPGRLAGQHVVFADYGFAVG